MFHIHLKQPYFAQNPTHVILTHVTHSVNIPSQSKIDLKRSKVKVKITIFQHSLGRTLPIEVYFFLLVLLFEETKSKFDESYFSNLTFSYTDTFSCK